MPEPEPKGLVDELETQGLYKILQTKIPAQHRTGLFNPTALSSLSAKMDEWNSLRLKEDERRDFRKPVYALLGSREKTARPLVSTPLDVSDFDYLQDLGLPGDEPMTRGVHANMYRGKKFTIRPIVGFGTPEDTNKRIRFLLDHGATGVNIVFDLPTIQEYDSDDPYAKGQVGLCGVSIQTVEDMIALWDGVRIEEMSVSLTTHYPSNTMILMAIYLVMAEEKGIKWTSLRGTVQNDLVMESVVRSAPDSLPPAAIFKLQVDNIEFLRREVPLWNYVTYNGYNLREGGVDEITEVAVAFSNALETVKEMIARGHSPDSFLDRMAFFWVVGNDFFAEISKMRAARRLWYKITRYVLNCTSRESLRCRFHVQTSGISLTRVEPLNNITRATLHGLAAVLGGAQSLHVSGYDEAYSVPTEQAHLITMRTQQILQEETGVADIVDPLGGSYYVEWLTNVIEERIVKEIDEISKQGGIVRSIEDGWLQRKISEFAYEEQRMQENGTIKIVGQNYQRLQGAVEGSEIDVFRYPEGAEERQRDRLLSVRKKRDSSAVEQRLEEIAEAASKGENLFPHVINAVRQRATEGEIARTFKRIYGASKVRLKM